MIQFPVSDPETPEYTAGNGHIIRRVSLSRAIHCEFFKLEDARRHQTMDLLDTIQSPAEIIHRQQSLTVTMSEQYRERGQLLQFKCMKLALLMAIQ